MHSLRSITFSRLSRAESGQGLAEYIIITLLVAIILIFGVRYFGSSVSGKFQNATQEITGLQDDSKLEKSANQGATAPEVREKPSMPEGQESQTGSGTRSPSGGSPADGSEMAKLRPDSVGLKDQDPITSISISASTLWMLAGLVLLGGVGYLAREAKKRKGKDNKKKPKKKLFSLGDRKGAKKGSAGQAMVEFVFVAITFLFVILGVVQLAMVLNAYAMVRYAAYNAARSAIVHGVNQEKMEEAARLSLVATFPSHGRADHRRGFMENYTAAKATDHQPALPPAMGSSDRITDVTVVNPRNLTSGTVVTFDDPAEEERAIITVQVRHYYELVIPLVNRILFYIYKRWREGTHEAQTLDYISATTDRERRPGGSFYDIEYRIPIVAHYTMRLQSDYEVP